MSPLFLYDQISGRQNLKIKPQNLCTTPPLETPQSPFSKMTAAKLSCVCQKFQLLKINHLFFQCGCQLQHHVCFSAQVSDTSTTSRSRMVAAVWAETFSCSSHPPPAVSLLQWSGCPEMFTWQQELILRGWSFFEDIFVFCWQLQSLCKKNNCASIFHQAPQSSCWRCGQRFLTFNIKGTGNAPCMQGAHKVPE